MTTRIRYAQSGDVKVAFQVTGRGPLELVLVPGLVSHLELDWEYPGAARLFERLGAFARLIRFDRRGTGLSDRHGVVPTFESTVDDVLAVMDAAGCDRAALFGVEVGVPAAIRIAATRPERGSALVLYDGFLRRSVDQVVAEAERVQSDWGVEADPSLAAADEALRSWWIVRSRAAASPGFARALVLSEAQIDVRDDLGTVDCATLVISRGVDPAEGRAVAEGIGGARLVQLPGDATLPFVEPDQIADAVEEFLTGVRPARGPRVLSGEPGSTIAGYRIEALVARGGMGAVYLAHDERLGRKVALKVIAPELAGDERFRERFLREWKIAASLEHPSIVPIYDAGEADGQLYIAMRYVEETDLRSLVAGERSLEPPRALAIASQVASALDAAHARGVVHRDVKPGNVLLDAAEHCYLCDFGLTKDVASVSGLTATGQLVGTLDYIAPEQIRAEEIDGRADQYSLACVVYECLAGVPPFRRESEAQMLWAHMQDPPPPVPRLPALDPVFVRALAKDPVERFESCSAFVAAAREALGLAPAQVAARRRLRLGRRLVLLGAVLVALAAIGIGIALLRGDGKTVGGVTASPNSVAVIDPGTNRLVAAIPVGRVPSAVAVGEGAVWVLNVDDRTVSRIEPKTQAVERTFAVGGTPTDLAVGAGSVWLADGVADRLVRFEPDSGETATIRLPRLHSDSTRLAIAVGAGSVWAATEDADVVRVDPRTGRVQRVRGVTQVGPGSRDDPSVAVGEGAVWVATGRVGEDSVAKINPETDAKVDEAQLGEIGDVAVGSGAVWATDFGGGVVWQVHPLLLRNRAPIRVGPFPIGVAVGAGTVWVANSGDGTVSRIDPGTGAVRSIRVGGSPRGIAVGGGRVWVTVD